MKYRYISSVQRKLSCGVDGICQNARLGFDLWFCSYTHFSLPILEPFYKYGLFSSGPRQVERHHPPPPAIEKLDRGMPAHSQQASGAVTVRAGGVAARETALQQPPGRGCRRGSHPSHVVGWARSVALSRCTKYTVHRYLSVHTLGIMHGQYSTLALQ